MKKQPPLIAVWRMLSVYSAGQAIIAKTASFPNLQFCHAFAVVLANFIDKIKINLSFPKHATTTANEAVSG